MNREQAYISLLQATAKIQHSVSIMLEAKALEAEKSRNWICNHLSSAAFADHTDQLAQTLNIHQQLIEVIEGLTRMETGLAKNLKAVLGEEESSSGFGGDSGGLFDFGGNLK